MKTVIIRGKFTLPFGNVIHVASDEIIKIGEKIKGSDGITYEVKGIIPQTRPNDNTFGIIYEK